MLLDIFALLFPQNINYVVLSFCCNTNTTMYVLLQRFIVCTTLFMFHQLFIRLLCSLYISLVTRYMYMYYFYISLCNYIHVLRCSYFIVCYVQHYSVYHVSDWLLYTRTCNIVIIFHCRLLCTHTQMYNIIVFIFHLLPSICIVVLIHIIMCYLSRLLILLKCYKRMQHY